MALTTIAGGGFCLDYLPANLSGAPDITGAVTYQMNAANEQCGCVVQIPVACNVRYVSFFIDTVTSAPSDNHEFRLETVDAATGLSTGTLIGTNTNGTILLNTTGWKTVTLTADAVLTAGQYLAMIVKAPAANFGDIRLGSFSDDQVLFPYALAAPSAGSVQTGSLLAALETDTNVVLPLDLFPISSITGRAINTGTAVKRGAIRFRLPVPARVSGWHLWADLDGDFDVVFYDSDGVTATTLYTFDKDRRGSTGPNAQRIKFTTPKTLLANTWYRVAIVPSSATSVTFYTMDVNAAKYLQARPGGEDIHYSTAGGVPSAEGDWTQVTTSRIFASLFFDQMDNGVGSGGGEVSHVFMG